MNLLSVEGVSKSYGERIIFEPLSFGVSIGQKIALIAKNGSGKTTLIKCILGMVIPNSGFITFNPIYFGSSITTVHLPSIIAGLALPAAHISLSTSSILR